MIPLSGTVNSWNAGNPSAIAPDAINAFGATKELFCFTGKFCCPMMRFDEADPESRADHGSFVDSVGDAGARSPPEVISNPVVVGPPANAAELERIGEWVVVRIRPRESRFGGVLPLHAKAQIHGELGAHLPLVLNIGGEDQFPAGWELHVEVAPVATGLVEQEGGEGVCYPLRLIGTVAVRPAGCLAPVELEPAPGVECLRLQQVIALAAAPRSRTG